MATPPIGESGIKNFTGKASFDGVDVQITGMRTIALNCPTINLSPATGALTAGTQGTAYTPQVFTPSGGGPSYTYSVVVGSLPPGLTLSPGPSATGTLSGTPTTPGPFSFTIRATDVASGCTGQTAYTLTINCPTITITTTLPSGTVTQAYLATTLAATGGTTPYTFALASGSTLPPGLSLNNGTISGTPTLPGSFTFTINVTDANNCPGSRAYTVMIGCPTVTLSPTTLPTNVTAGTAYPSTTITASPAGGNYTFAVAVAGTLPPGLTLSSAGVLRGTPMAKGTFNFTVTATGFVNGANNCSGTQAYSIIVTCPTITLTAPPLANGTVGAAYNQTVSALPAGGNYTFAFTGTLPPGLTLSPTGVLSGTPTMEGPFNFTVTATGFVNGANNCQGSQAYSLTIVSCPALGITCPANIAQTIPGLSAPINYPAPIINNCASATVACVPPSGSTFQIGTTTVTCTATAGSNTANCSFTVSLTNFVPQPQQALKPFDPLVCNGPGSVINGSFGITNTSAIAQTGTLTAALPPQLIPLPGSCVVNTGTCSFINANTAVQWTGTLTPGQTVNVSYQAQIADGTPSGTQLCAITTASFPPGNPASIQVCTTVSCPLAGPGAAYAAASPVSDQRAGSVLVFYLYTSDAANSQRQNTRLSLTNTDGTRTTFVHLFFVDGASCSVADSYICLTPNQTASFLTSDLDPGATGFIVAVAVDARGCPISFNHLLGDEYVKLASGHAANLGAEAFGALAGGLPVCNDTSPTAQLNFDGISYNLAPRTLALSNPGSRAAGNDTLLVVNRLGGNLATGAATLTGLFGVVYDDAEQPFSFSFSPGTCQFRSALSSSFPRTVPRLEQIIPAGRSGWLKLSSQNDQALLGAALNFNANAGAQSNAFNQGHNLHKLTLTNAATLTIPVFPPRC